MASSALHVLIVDDSPEDRYSLRRLLTRTSPSAFSVTEVSCGDQALATCATAPPDCILLDYQLPDIDGLEVLAALRAWSDVPVIVLTGAGSEALAVETLQRGAQDYLVKGAITPERLELTIQHAMATVRLTRERDQTLAMLTTVLDALPVGILVLDADLRVRQVNPTLATMLDLPATAIPGQTLAQLWPELTTSLAAPCAQLLHGEPFQDLEFCLPTPDGPDARWLSVSGTPLRGTDGAGSLGLLTVQDITARRQAEHKLRASEIRYRILFETMAQGVVYQDSGGQIIDANPMAEQILGLTLDELHGRTSLDPRWHAIHEDGTAIAGETHPAMVALRTGREVRDVVMGVYHPGHDAYRWIRIQAVPHVQAGAAGAPQVYTLFDDITERRATAQVLEHERRQLAAILDTMHEGVIAIRPDRSIALINPSAFRLRDLDPANPPSTLMDLGQTRHQLCDAHNQPLDPEAFPLLRVLHGERFAGIELRQHFSSDQPERWHLINGTPVYGEDGTLILGVITFKDITERKQAEEELRTRERQLALAHAVAGLGSWYHDLRTNMVTFDARAQAHYGVVRAALPVTAILANVHPDDALRLMQAMQGILDPAGSGHAEIECRVLQLDGSVRWIANHAQVVFTGTGAVRRPAFGYGATQDITARKAEAAALQAAYAEAEAQAARLESLLAYAPVGISLLDTELRFQHINAHLAAINGLPPEAHLGRTLGEVLPALASTLDPIYRQVLTTGEPLLDVEIRGETPATPGSIRTWLASYFPVRERTGAILGVGVMILDITVQRQAEQARQVAYQQLETILQTLDEGVMAVAPDGRFVLINPVACQQLRLNPAALPRTMAELDMPTMVTLSDQSGAPIPEPERPVSRALRGERFQNLELRVGVVGAPEERWMLFSGAPVYAADGALMLAVVTGNDITQRKRDAADLAAHAERLSHTNAQLTRALQLKDEFLAMMSHELRTPLNVILSTTDALTEAIYGPVSERQHKALATIDRSGHHLLAILNDILDLTALEAGHARLEMQRVDVEILCRRAVQFVQATAQQKQIQLLRTLAVGVEGLCADERRLTQILVNLLDNAVKFTPVGGRVGLEVTADAAQEWIAFTVWDTGIGIAEADYARLFHPFTQVDGRLSRPYEGIGLGLTLVRWLVELHGGSIRLDSTPGQGSRFTVRLPWSAQDNVTPDPMRVREPRFIQSWAHPPTVVIADDHEPTLQFYGELLREQGCVVVLVRTGTEALAQVQATRPDVAVLDIQMPEMDGLTVIRQIRADPFVAATPVIALTALAMPGDQEHCREAGANAYLAKPVSIRALLTTIAEVLPHPDATLA